MPALSPLFFKNLLTEMTALEREELNARLKGIYGKEPIAFQHHGDFETSKEQLLKLLTYIVNLNPETLQIFAAYSKKVAALTETSAPPDLLVTLKTAKTTLENTLPAIISRHSEVDKAALNSITITVCYNGAYANLESALIENFLDRSSLSNLVHMAKKDLVMQFGQRYLEEEQLLEFDGNEIHMVNSLHNYVADTYGLPMVEDEFATTLLPEILNNFSDYAQVKINAAALVEKISQYLPALPTHISTAAEIRTLDDFFQMLGEKNPGHAQYQFLYKIEEIDDMPVLVIKEGARLFQSCIVAEYLAHAHVISETQFSSDTLNIVYSGEYLVSASNGTYILLTDEQLLTLLTSLSDTSDDLQIQIFKQISTEALLTRYLEYNANDLSTSILEELLNRADITFAMLERIYAELEAYPHHPELRQFALYIARSNTPLSTDKLIYLSNTLTERELEYYLKHGLEHDYPDMMEAILIRTGDWGAIEPLVECAIRFNKPNVLEMLNRHSDISKIRIDGLTVAHLAIKYKCLGLLTKLKELNIDLNQPAYDQLNVSLNYRGRAPIHMAAFKGDIEALLALHSLGVNLQAKSYSGDTAASIAIEEGQFDFLTSLSKIADLAAPEFARDGMPLAHQAVQLRKINFLRLFKTVGVSLDAFDAKGLTPTHVAIKYYGTDLLTILHELGADLNQESRDGLTPAGFAACYGHEQLFKTLKELNVDLDFQDSKGATAVYHAAANGQHQAICNLAALNANLNIPNAEGNTPVFVAAAKGNIKALECLARNNANLNTVNAEGQSPAYIAVANDQILSLEELISSNADLSQIYQKADTLLMRIGKNSNFNMFRKLLSMNVHFSSATLEQFLPEFLVNTGPDIILYTLIKSNNDVMLNIILNFMIENNYTLPPNLILYAAQRAKSGAIFSLVQHYAPDYYSEELDTPAHVAARCGNFEVLKSLLKSKQTINAVNEDGVSPAFIAAATGQHRMLELLKTVGAANEPVQIEKMFLKKLVHNKTSAILKNAFIKMNECSAAKMTLTPRDIAEIMGYKEVIAVIDNAQPDKLTKVGFFTSNPDAMDCDLPANESSPAEENSGKAAGKRAYISVFSQSNSQKKPKSNDQENPLLQEYNA